MSDHNPRLMFPSLLRWKTTVKVLFVFLFCLALQVQAEKSPAQKRKELEAKRRELQAAIRKNKNELIRIRAEAHNKEKELKVLGSQITQRQQLISNINQQTFEIEVQIIEQRKMITTLKADVERLKADYAAYLEAAYKKRVSLSNLLFFVFDSKSLHQALRRMRYLNAYGNYRQKQARLILKTQHQMIEAIQEMINIKQVKLGLRAEKEKEKVALIKDKEEETAMLSKLQEKEQDLKKKLERQEQAARKLNRDIELQIAREIELARRAEEERRAKAKKANKPEAPRTSTSYLSSADQKLGIDFASSKGKLPWPVAGTLAESFGNHAHPTLKGVVTTNNGIDIATQAGASVKAVYKGVVKGIFPIPGLGKVVLISHGEYYTVYARLEDNVSVKIGDPVEAGKVIGQVAVYPETGAGRLHFEVWKQRLFQNPLPWLRAK